MKVIALAKPEPDLDGALAALDELRQAIVEGRMIGFIAVSVAPDDSVEAWAGTTRPISRLRMAGAIATLAYAYQGCEV